MLDINEFVDNFAGLFDETAMDAFTAETVFRDIEEWSSLMALSVIAMVDEEYGLKMTGDDIRRSKTVGDLVAVLQAKQA